MNIIDQRQAIVYSAKINVIDQVNALVTDHIDERDDNPVYFDAVQPHAQKINDLMDEVLVEFVAMSQIQPGS